jgi:hypothetical protein
MTDIFCRLNDDLKLEVLSFFSAYIIKEKIIEQLWGSEEEIYSITNIVDQEICYGINEDFGYDEQLEYLSHLEPTRHEYTIEINESIDLGENGFYIDIKTFIEYSIKPVRLSDIFYVEYIQNSYFHSNMWRIISGEGVNGGIIFVNDNELTDIMKQLQFKDDVISETLKKYKSKVK